MLAIKGATSEPKRIPMICQNYKSLTFREAFLNAAGNLFLSSALVRLSLLLTAMNPFSFPLKQKWISYLITFSNLLYGMFA